MPPDQDPSNKFAAFIEYGGPTDVVAGFSFETATRNYYDALKARGDFAVRCNNGGGHSPGPSPRRIAWMFFQAHPWGTSPSPWAGGLPAGFPLSDCAL